jgi:hypothetical protein
MYITMRNGEDIIIESTQEKLKVFTDYHGNISLDGNKKYKTVEDIIFEKRLEDFKPKIGDGFGKDVVEKTISFVSEYVEQLHTHLRLDKSIIFDALEKKRDYSAPNYYQESNFPPIKTIDELKKEISSLQQQLWDINNKHKDEIIEWQKKLTNAQKILVEKTEVETDIEYSLDINVNCPYCDSWQSVDTSGYDHDGDFETNVECDHCGKMFSVKATK